MTRRAPTYFLVSLFYWCCFGLLLWLPFGSYYAWAVEWVGRQERSITDVLLHGWPLMLLPAMSYWAPCWLAHRHMEGGSPSAWQMVSGPLNRWKEFTLMGACVALLFMSMTLGFLPSLIQLIGLGAISLPLALYLIFLLITIGGLFYIAPTLHLLPDVLAQEDLGLLDSMRRSRELYRRHRSMLSSLGTLLFSLLVPIFLIPPLLLFVGLSSEQITLLFTESFSDEKAFFDSFPIFKSPLTITFAIFWAVFSTTLPAVTGAVLYHRVLRVESP